eukprot:jgi/Chrzof1/9204/Cz03g39220.t1
MGNSASTPDTKFDRVRNEAKGSVDAASKKATGVLKALDADSKAVKEVKVTAKETKKAIDKAVDKAEKVAKDAQKKAEDAHKKSGEVKHSFFGAAKELKNEVRKEERKLEKSSSSKDAVLTALPTALFVAFVFGVWLWREKPWKKLNNNGGDEGVDKTEPAAPSAAKPPKGPAKKM